MYPLTRGCGNGIDINNKDNNKRLTGTDYNSQSMLLPFFLIVIVRHSRDLIIVGIIIICWILFGKEFCVRTD